MLLRRLSRDDRDPVIACSTAAAARARLPKKSGQLKQARRSRPTAGRVSGPQHADNDTFLRSVTALVEERAHPARPPVFEAMGHGAHGALPREGRRARTRGPNRAPYSEPGGTTRRGRRLRPPDWGAPPASAEPDPALAGAGDVPSKRSRVVAPAQRLLASSSANLPTAHRTYPASAAECWAAAAASRAVWKA